MLARSICFFGIIYLKLFCLSDQQSLYKGVEMKLGQNYNQCLLTHEPTTTAKPRQRLIQTPWKLKRRQKFELLIAFCPMRDYFTHKGPALLLVKFNPMKCASSHGAG